MATLRRIFIIGAAALTAIVGLAIISSRLRLHKAHSAIVSWQRSSSAVKGYYVYRRRTGEPYQRIQFAASDETTYVDSSVTGGNTYYYVVTAISPSGEESAHSAEVT